MHFGLALLSTIAGAVVPRQSTRAALECFRAQVRATDLVQRNIQFCEARARSAELSVDKDAQALGAAFVVTAAILVKGHTDAVVVVEDVVESKVLEPAR